MTSDKRPRARTIASYLEPISIEAVARIGAVFEADEKRLQSGKADEETLVMAYGYFVRFPELRDKIGYDRDGDVTCYKARFALEQVHKAAQAVLIREAERVGLDGGPLDEYGRICREIISGGPAKFRAASELSWPDCLGADRASLPLHYQTAIRDGEAVLRRLEARLDLAEQGIVPALWSGDTTATTPAGGAGATCKSVRLSDPVPISWLRTVVTQKVCRGDCSKLVSYLKRRTPLLQKIARRWHIERSEAIRIFKPHKSTIHSIEEYGDGGD